MQIRSLLFAATLFVFTACQDDLTEQKGQWETSTRDWSARLEKLKKSQADLEAKAKAFVVPEGDAVVAAEKALIEKSVAGANAALADAEQHLTTSKATLDGLIAKGKKIPVEIALSAEKGVVDGAVAKAESLVSAANEGLDLLGKKIATLKAEGEAIKSRTDAWTAEAKKKGGLLAIDDLSFDADALSVEKSRIALSSLVGALKSCADLKVELAVNAVGEAADLGTKRVEALKTYLTSNGVPAGVIAKAAGTTAKEGEEKVGVTVATPCK